ncbi:hypothetical protein cypCar_00005611 [Cyprinus carpio]|nr:hypothetical protein cypCar_00005611 [Cyprinus carpio]
MSPSLSFSSAEPPSNQATTALF